MSNQDLRPRVFISYRRGDSGGWARAITERLIGKLEKDHVLFDIDSIAPGPDFVRSLNDRTANCDVLIAVIGKEWLNAQDMNGRPRLDNPEDFVRVEISAAPRRKIRIIPMLVDGARMPRPTELPTDLAGLAQREAIAIDDSRFQFTMEKLIPILVREGGGAARLRRPLLVCRARSRAQSCTTLRVWLSGFVRTGSYRRWRSC